MSTSSQVAAIRSFILKHVNQEGLSRRAAEKFGITPQAVNRHIGSLVKDKLIVSSGKTKDRTYRLAILTDRTYEYALKAEPAEDEVWVQDVRPILQDLPANVLDIWHWAFTEMFNNAVDHSGGTMVTVHVERTALDVEIMVADDGVGIFRKIQKALALPDERQAIFELAKGKLTTDSENHSGQGIFFTSRMVSSFDILSYGVYFSHDETREGDWLTDGNSGADGTAVFMKLENDSKRSASKTFAKYSVKGSYGFNKTVVPVQLARYGTDQLVSRSQAKRVLNRIDQFSQVIFDFEGVAMIGQAFADEIFRVFARRHPKVELIPAHANSKIMGLIQATIKSGRPGRKVRV